MTSIRSLKAQFIICLQTHVYIEKYNIKTRPILELFLEEFDSYKDSFLKIFTQTIITNPTNDNLSWLFDNIKTSNFADVEMLTKMIAFFNSNELNELKQRITDLENKLAGVNVQNGFIQQN